MNDWRALESPHYTVFYPPDNEDRARRMMYHLEQNRERVNRITGSDSREGRRQVVIAAEDYGLFAGGFAQSVNNRIGIFTARPGTDSGLSNYTHYYRLVSVHELTHMRQDRNVYGPSRALTGIFGDHLSPNFHSPRWLSEGIATYAESQTDPAEGRLNEGFFDAVLAGKAAQDEMPTLPQLTHDHNIYPRGHFYLFGSTFIRYLTEQYGRESTGEFISIYSRYFWVPFYNLLIPRANLVPAGGLDRAADKAFGKPFGALYAEWRRHEQNEHRDWQIDGEPVAETHRGTMSNLIRARGKLYYFRTDVQSVSPYQYRRVSRLTRYDPDTGDERTLLSTRASDVGRMQSVGDHLYFATREVEYGFQNYSALGWGGTATVKRYDLETGETRTLFQRPIRDFVARADGTIVYATERQDGFGSTIWRYRNGDMEKLGTVDELIAELHRHGDRIIAVSKKSGGTWDVTTLDLQSLRFERLIASNKAEKLVSVTSDGIYFSANYDRRVAVYRRDFATGDIERMTSGGYAREGVIAGGDFYFLSGVVDGMGLYKTDIEGEPIDAPANTRPEQSVDLDTLDVPIREQGAIAANLRELIPPDRRLAPVLAAGEDALGTNEFVLDFTAVGIQGLWRTRLFRPLSVAAFFDRDFTDGDSTGGISIAYPVYRSAQSGLSAITLDVQTDFDEVVPGAQIQFDTVNHRLALRQQAKLDDERPGTGFNSVATYNYWLDSGTIGLLGGVSSGFDTVDRNRTFEIDGVDEEARTERASLEYTQKLFEIRGGSWNPNTFAGDLYAGPFVDWIEHEGGEITSGGLQVQLEGGLANYNLIPTVGAAFADDGREKGFVRLRLAF